MSEPREELDKCSILHHNISYTGGGTYTLGAMLEAQVNYPHNYIRQVGKRSVEKIKIY